MTPEQQQAFANMSPEERAMMAKVQEKQAQRFQNLGIGNIQERQSQIQATQVASGGAVKNLNALKNIEAIRSGLKKQEIDQYLNSENPNTFQAIPVNAPRNPESEARKQAMLAEAEQAGLGALKPDSKSRQLQGVEAMFDFDSGGGGAYSDVIMGNGHNPYAQQANTHQEQHIPQGPILGESYGAGQSFDQIWANKKAQFQNTQGVQNNAPNMNAQYLQEAQQQIASNPAMQNMGFDMNTFMNAVETVASKIADQKIRTVLSEYSNNFNGPSAAEQRDAMKNTYKKVKGYEDVIKIGEKYFRLTEVRFRKKS